VNRVGYYPLACVRHPNLLPPVMIIAGGGLSAKHSRLPHPGIRATRPSPWHSDETRPGDNDGQIAPLPTMDIAGVRAARRAAN
jgi:hypothetical protein